MCRRLLRVVTERDTKSYGVNTSGLERNGFSEERLRFCSARFDCCCVRDEHHAGAAEMRKSLGDSDDVRS